MSRSVAAWLVTGSVALGLIVASAHVPWFWWSWQDGAETWPDDTGVWGPPAYVAGLPYSSVDVSPAHRRIVDVAVGVYLGLYILGLGLWARLALALSRASRPRWPALAVGGAGIVVSAGLVVVFGLAEYIAQKVGLYAAIASSHIVVAQWAGVRLFGPLLLGAGTALMAGGSRQVLAGTSRLMAYQGRGLLQPVARTVRTSRGGNQTDMDTRADLEALWIEHGFLDWKWLHPKDIVVSQWVRIKCMFGCGSYGKNACCPPNVPSVSECRQFFGEYSAAVVLHFEKRVERPEDRHAWSREVNRKLLDLERAVFLQGYQKAFLLFMDSCGLCADCPGVREECRYPRSSRPSPEAMAMDVFSTVRQAGYPIEVLSDYTQAMNRYAFMLVE